MRPTCNLDALEALVEGRLGPEAESVAAHAAGCAECAAELAWLRRERALVERRRAGEEPVPAALWDGVARRLVRPGSGARPGGGGRPKGAFRPWMGVVLGVAVSAAAALTVVLRPIGFGGSGGSDESAGSRGSGGRHGWRWSWGKTPGAERHVRIDIRLPDGDAAAEESLVAAEAQYRAAIAMLEAQYRVARRRMPARAARRFDHTLERSRRALASVDRAGDIDDRMRTLDGYADYLRSLQTIVYEEAR